MHRIVLLLTDYKKKSSCQKLGFYLLRHSWAVRSNSASLALSIFLCPGIHPAVNIGITLSVGQAAESGPLEAQGWGGH